MTKLAFEDIDDARVRRPYLFVFLLEDEETYWVGQFSPFMQITITDNDALMFNFYPSEKDLCLSKEQWQEILQTAETFLDETLRRDAD
ncbi:MULTISPECIES: hypothetical protein [Paraburkholderia]|jgi:hypothetical protein|uniref:hypothetical protein n=1 Tax=Paraburkholderia TaxID=1822464 RepID=UPI0038B6CCA6